MKREGIAFAGNLIVDHIKTIDVLPNRSELTKIIDVMDSTGGSVCNGGMDFAILAQDIPVRALGVIGEDKDGDLVLSRLEKHHMNADGVIRRGVTSFTDVFAENSTGCRTFFQYGGGGDTFDIGDVDVEKLDVKIFHIGYLLLLNTLDQEDPEYGTRMARLLDMVQKQGCLTSIDMVSENGNRWAKVVRPALKYVDYLIINELEAGRATGIDVTDENGNPVEEKVKLALQKLKELGVSRWAVIHAAQGAWGLDEQGRFAYEPSKKLPKGFIKGTVGAGDAFCAGALLAAYQEKDIHEALRYGNAAALQCLRGVSATDGMCSLEEALAFYQDFDKMYPRK